MNNGGVGSGTWGELGSYRAGVPAVLLCLAVACGHQARPAPAAGHQREMLVAAVWPWQAHPEARFGRGLQLALEEVNASGGIGGRPLRVEKWDDQESVDEGRRIAQVLGTRRDVTAVIGHLQSYVTIPAAAIYDLNGLALVAPASTSAELTRRGYARVFRTIFTDPQMGREMGAFAVRQGLRRLAIVYVQSEYGRGLANAFEAEVRSRGADVLDRQSYDAGADLSPGAAARIIQGWKRLDLDGVFVAGQVPQAAIFIAELRAEGLDVPVLGGDALGTQALVSIGGSAVEGTMLASPFHPHDPRSEVRSFVEMFRKRFGAEPDVSAALAYDALWVLASAARGARDVSRAAIIESLRAMPPWKGVTGSIAFRENGDRVDVLVDKVVVRGGKFEYLPDSGRVSAQTSLSKGLSYVDGR